jgi:hypothetical protein
MPARKVSGYSMCNNFRSFYILDHFRSIFSIFFVFFVSFVVNLFSQTIGSIPPPPGFERFTVDGNSFAQWLRQLHIKPVPSPVLDYRGRIHKKSSDSTIAAVIDLDVSGERMQQCMDILVRLRAEYLWHHQSSDQISFPLPGGYSLDWTAWLQGYRPQFKGIQMTLRKTNIPDSSRKNFESYLHTLFAESHTQQFYHAYPAIEQNQIKPGDFIVKKGSKSHAILIVDLAVDTNGSIVALIGHGDTPACEFHLLNYKETNPWFPLEKSQKIVPLPIRRKMSWDGLRRFP